jgi:hypothetical protein
MGRPPPLSTLLGLKELNPNILLPPSSTSPSGRILLLARGLNIIFGSPI